MKQYPIICRPFRGFTVSGGSCTQGLRPGLESFAPPGLPTHGPGVAASWLAAGLILIATVAGVFGGAIPACAADAPGSTYSVIISSLPGEPDYEKILQGWGKDLYTALRKNAAEDHVYWLAAKKETGVYAESRLDQITKVFDLLATLIQPQDAFELLLIGHGSFDDFDFRINIPGPDLTAAQLAEMLGRIRAERQLVANMTSSSGATIASLRRKGRILITATSAGKERNFSQFPRYFIEALREPAADTDKNQEVSVLEAFRFASHEVARYYQQATRLATEHALLEDRGDGDGVREPGADNGEGLLAASMVLVRLGDERSGVESPEARALRADKRRVEEAIEALKYRKASLNSKEYSQQLEKLLIQLAQLQQKLDTLEKK